MPISCVFVCILRTTTFVNYITKHTYSDTVYERGFDSLISLSSIHSTHYFYVRSRFTTTAKCIWRQSTPALEKPYESANTDRNWNAAKSYWSRSANLTQVLAGNRQLTHQDSRNNHHRLFPSDHCSRLPIVLHGVDHCLPVGVAQLKTTPAWC